MNKIEHLFDCLAEEAAEVVRAAMKINRFCVDGSYPDGQGNVEKLVQELNDVLAVAEMICDHLPMQGLGERNAINAKKAKVMQMMQVARARGSLEIELQIGERYCYEDELPPTITDQQYDDWYRRSSVKDGVRVGPFRVGI